MRAMRQLACIGSRPGSRPTAGMTKWKRCIARKDRTSLFEGTMSPKTRVAYIGSRGLDPPFAGMTNRDPVTKGQNECCALEPIPSSPRRRGSRTLIPDDAGADLRWSAIRAGTFNSSPAPATSPAPSASESQESRKSAARPRRRSITRDSACARSTLQTLPSYRVRFVL